MRHPHKRWTPADDAELARLAKQGLGWSDIAQRLQRSIAATQVRASTLSIKVASAPASAPPSTRIQKVPGFSVTAIDWLNACRRKALEPLISLYDDHAMQECVCDDRKVIVGKQALRAYWIEQFKAHTVSDLVSLKAEGHSGSVSYRTDIGIVQAHLFLDKHGKIARIACGPEGSQINP